MVYDADLMVKYAEDVGILADGTPARKGELGCMVVEETHTITSEINLEQLNRFVSQDNVVVLKWNPDLHLELDALVERRRLFDAVLVDCSECGFLFPAELLVAGCQNINHFLELNGALIFLQQDKAFAVVRETLMGSLSFHVFNTHAELFDYSPPLARQVQNVLTGQSEDIEQSTDLSRQVLMSTVPVLTTAGIKMKGAICDVARRNCVLAAVDNYTPLGTISQSLTSQARISHEELLEELKELEKVKAIFPLFSKIPFLVNCFRQQTPFSLKEYLCSAKLVSEDQIDALMFELQNTSVKDRLTLGPFIVKKGLISARQLEVAMQDQAFYGQAGESNRKLVKSASEETQVQSLVGHLGTTDPSNLLQNLATNRETGVLSVEYRDLHFRAQFDLGKLTHAKVGKVEGNRAIAEFASAWKDGIFVFIHRTPPADLSKDNCKVTKPLDKLLLDAALSKDNTDVVLNKLPKGIHSVLEKNTDDDDLLNCGALVDPVEEEIALTSSEVDLMKRTHGVLDGLTTLSSVIRYFGNVTTAELARAVGLLLHYQLVEIPSVDISVPLTKFKLLTKCVAERINAERSTAYLRLSLRDGIGFSQRARVFALTPNGDVGIDMAAARQAQTSLTNVIADLENWQIKYIEYVSQDIPREELLELIQRIHGEHGEA